MAIVKSKNATIYLPSFGNNYTTDISVILFFPTDAASFKNYKVTYLAMITASVPDWFNKYVVVIFNDYQKLSFKGDFWKSIQSEFVDVITKNNLQVNDISLCLFGKSSADSSLIQQNMGKVTVVGKSPNFSNLFLIDPYPEGKLSENIKALSAKSTKTFLMYNTNNWVAKLSLKFTDLSSIVSSYSFNATPVNTKDTSTDRDKIVGKFFTKWKTTIETSLVTPTLKPDPITENKGNKEFNENKTPEKTPETNSEPETPASKDTGGKLKMTFQGIDNLTQSIFSINTPIEFQILIDQPANTQNIDDFVDGEDDEYTETGFEGLEEAGIILTPLEKDTQLAVAAGQEDSSSGLTPPGTPAKIEPVGSFDALLKLAGDCARELGKNPRVKYENLKKGYIKGVHGLCPQGTQAVIYAMTGVKKLGQQSGNADYFSFKYSKSSFPSSHYNAKIRVGKDYWKDKSKWQIGDVIAVGYTNGKPYGHIQVWTGYNWMSDFKQNALQSGNVDWDTPALWRLNENGIKAVSKQMGKIS
jgi:hypothetical protein